MINPKSVISLVANELSGKLIDEHLVAELEMFSAQLPWFVRSYYFELRDLDRLTNSQLDVLVSFEKKHFSAAQKYFSTRSQSLMALMATLMEPDTWLGSQIPYAWLEFDDVLRSCYDGQQEFCIHACIDNQYLAVETNANSALSSVLPAVSKTVSADCSSLNSQPRNARPGNGKPKYASLAVAQSVLTALAEAELLEAQRTALDNCFKFLPADARFIHVSLMRSRSPQAIKLYGCIRFADIEVYLRSIGWFGDKADHSRDSRLLALLSLWERYNPNEFCFFDLSIGEGIEPYFALVTSPVDYVAVGHDFKGGAPETVPTKDRQFKFSDTDRTAFILALVEEQLIPPEKSAFTLSRLKK